jgi:dihydrofolate synthase/folylpolyglutamate synthase
MVAAALTACGVRTGLYTSPHLHRLEERFRVDGAACSADELISLVERVRSASDHVEKTSGAPSFFELTTALALLHFDSCQCEAVVIEVGLGGRLDSTNVCAPTISMVTSIGLDHQHVLGHDLVSIAREKAGIIKPGVPVISGVTDAEAAEVIEQQATEQGAPLFCLGRDFDYRAEPLPTWGSTVQYRGIRSPLSPELTLQVAMEGDHQARNAVLAMATLDLLRHHDTIDGNSHAAVSTPPGRPTGRLVLPDAAINDALSTLQCEARLEHALLDNDVLAIIDASHNEDSIQALCQCLKRRSAERPISIVFGTSLDKSADVMVSALAEVANQLILTRYHGNPRFHPPEPIRDLIPESLRNATRVVEDPIEACRRAIDLAKPGGTMVVCGSFFLAAETRHWILQQAQPFNSHRR